MKGRILVADDEADIRELVALSLDLGGYDVTTTKDGEEALTTIRASMPDAVVLDVMMPNLTGYEVARALQLDPRTAAIPVVMLSAKCQGSDVDTALASGALTFLIKPFAPQELVRVVDGLIQTAVAPISLLPVESAMPLFGD